MNDTVFALATAPGKSGVAIVRVSGAQARVSLAAFGATAAPPPRVATRVDLKDAVGALLDRAIVLHFPAPASFTGEDVVEYHIHGSRAVVSALLERLSRLPGFRPADPGEFARRAFQNGKLDLTAVEGLADLIDAETDSQRRQALRAMTGEVAAFFRGVRMGVVESLACLEAYIDFPDEDIPASVLGEISRRLQAVRDSIQAQLADRRAGEKIRDGVAVALIGPPNVGKSSLLNLLAKRDVAIVSPEPGTTRDVIEVHLDLGGYRVTVADTAGLRESLDAVEREGVRRSRERAETADIRLVLADATTPGTDLPEFLAGPATLFVCNKCDLGLPSPLPSLGGVAALPLSVAARTGIEALLDRLEAMIAERFPAESSFIARARHRVHLERALPHVARYLAPPALPLELACEELRRAATELGKITGEITTDELLGHIFSRFCIGK